MGRRGGSHAGTLTKLSMKFLATKGFCNKHSPFCPHLFLREGSLDGRICFSSSFIFFFLEPDTWTHFHSSTPNTFPHQCWISLYNIHSIPWKCRAFSEDLIYGNIIIGGYHVLVSMIMWHSLNMSNLGSRKLQTFFSVFKAAYNWTPRREQLRKWKTQWLRQRTGLSKRWYTSEAEEWAHPHLQPLAPPPSIDLGALLLGRIEIYTNSTLTMIRLYMAVMWIWNEIKEMYTLVDKTLPRVKNDHCSWGLIRFGSPGTENRGKDHTHIQRLKDRKWLSLSSIVSWTQTFNRAMKYCYCLPGPLMSMSIEMLVNNQRGRKQVIESFLNNFSFFKHMN